MIVLALDTTLGACSVAVGDGERVLAAGFVETVAGQAEHIMPMIAAVLEEASLAPQDVARIGVTVGPGSFTGSRIGIAAARGLGVALGCPVVGLTTFAAMAAALNPRHPAITAIDARRDQVYLQAFRGGQPCMAPVAVADRDIPSVLPAGLGSAIIAGSGAPQVAAALRAQGGSPLEVITPAWPDAAVFARLIPALEPDPAGMPLPLYLRVAGAAPQWVQNP